MTLFIYHSKNERARWACYAVAYANRWMGIPQTAHAGLTAHLTILYYIMLCLSRSKGIFFDMKNRGNS